MTQIKAETIKFSFLKVNGLFLRYKKTTSIVNKTIVTLESSRKVIKKPKNNKKKQKYGGVIY